MNDDACSSGGERRATGGMCGGFSPLVWHTLVAALLLAVITAGCSSGNSGSSAGTTPAAPVGSSAAPKAAAQPSALSPLARTPKAVQDAFAQDYPQGATVSKVHHRLMPDGMVHYTITSADRDGKTHDDEYRADGLKVNPK